MAASGKFDLASGSPDRPLYASGPRGSCAAASLDRAGSFREGVESPILSSLPSMSRKSSITTAGEVTSFFQCLRFDPKLVPTKQRPHRLGEFKRLATVVLGISTDDAPSVSLKGKPPVEDLKRFKSGLDECFRKAKQRQKMFMEALSVLNKLFPSVPSRKRYRADVLSSERPNSLLSSDRTTAGADVGKMEIKNHSISSSLELEQPKMEERTKSSIPNKRTRTSLLDSRMDVRANALARPYGAVDRERELLKAASSSTVQSEDRSLPMGVDGWEKSKMKKKRSGIKPDAPSLASVKPVDGNREPKLGMVHRVAPDARSRLSDSHGFRAGAANGVAGAGKMDGVSQQAGLGMRFSVPRNDQDNASTINDRRDRPTGPDKERVNLRTVNKTSIHEDFTSASPTLNGKVNSSVRAPRSGAGLVPKLSALGHQANSPNDWELSHCTNKLPASVGPNSRKRTPSACSSSPPVAQWAGQRPQKISRTARRTNFVPIVSSQDDTPASGSPSDTTGNENGLGFARCMSSSSQQAKLKVDNFASATLSESEESVALETKSREMGKKFDNMDEKAAPSQKTSTLLLASRKNKMLMGDELGDGVRRQGRTGRGLSSTRSPMRVDKLGGVGTAKQLRTARHGFDRTESKAGRPLTRKLSDRRAYTRQKHTAINSTPDFLVGSDDGHEELVAAANAVISCAHVSSRHFWRQMEHFFGFLSDADIKFLKEQGNLDPTAVTQAPVSSDVEGGNCVPNSVQVIENRTDTSFQSKPKGLVIVGDQLAFDLHVNDGFSLWQRLITAMIPEEDEEFCCSENENLNYDSYGDEFEVDRNLKPDSLSDRVIKGQYVPYDGYSLTSSVRSRDALEEAEIEKNSLALPSAESFSKDGYPLNGVIPEQTIVTSMACSEFQNDSMDETLRKVLWGVGISPDPVHDISWTDGEEITQEISKLQDAYNDKVSEKKRLASALLKPLEEARELQEREFEQQALDKLIGMAYEKYMTYWGPNASAGKSASSKVAKPASLLFVRQTLERCHTFEDTGKSCFSEPLFKEMFLSGLSHLNDTQSGEISTDDKSIKPYRTAAGHSLGASLGSQQSPSGTSRLGLNMDNHDIYSSDVLTPLDHPSEQTTGREDGWSYRAKKRELSLDVVGGALGSSCTSPGIGSSLASSTKGKRSDRDREGKGHGREVLSRNGTVKVGRPLSSNIKGERKSKVKPKQKTTQLSASGSGILGKVTGQPKDGLSSVPKSHEMSTCTNAKEKDDFGLAMLDDPLDLSNLQLPGMDVLDVPDDLGGQGQDIGSWLNIDEDGLQDHDFMGLEIPMDDLSDLNMMV